MDINKKFDEANLTEAQKKLMMELFNSMLPNSNQQDSSGNTTENLLGQSDCESTEASTSYKSTKKQKTLETFFNKNSSQTSSKFKKKVNNPKVQESVAAEDIPKLCHTTSNVSTTCESELTPQNEFFNANSPSCETRISPNNEEQDVTSVGTKGTLTEAEIIKQMFEKRSIVCLEKLDIKDCEVKSSEPVSKRKLKRPENSHKMSPLGKSKKIQCINLETDEGTSQDKQFVSNHELNNFPEDLTQVKASNTILDSVSISETKLSEQNAKKVLTCVERSTELNKRKLRVSSSRSLSREEIVTVDGTNKNHMIVNKNRDGKASSQDKQPILKLNDSISPVRRNSRNQRTKKELVCVEKTLEKSMYEICNENLIDKPVTLKKNDSLNSEKVNNDEVLTPDELSVSSPRRNLRNRCLKKSSIAAYIPEMSKDEVSVHFNENLNDKNCLADKNMVDNEGSRQIEQFVSESNQLTSPKRKLRNQSSKKESASVEVISEMSKDEANVHSKKLNNDKPVTVKEIDKISLPNSNTMDDEGSTKDKLLVLELNDSVISPKRKLRNKSAKKESICVEKNPEMSMVEASLRSDEKLDGDKPVTVEENDKNTTNDKGPSQNEGFVSESSDLVPVSKRKQRKRNAIKDLNCNERNTEMINSDVGKKIDGSPIKERLASADESDKNCLSDENIMNSSQDEQLLANLAADFAQQNPSEVCEAVKNSESNLVSVSTLNRRQSKRNIRSKNELISVEGASDLNKHKEQNFVSLTPEESSSWELATVDKNVDFVNKSPIKVITAEVHDFPPNSKQNSLTKKRLGKIFSKSKNVSTEKKVSTNLSTEIQNPGTIDGSDTICKSATLVWSSCIIDEQGLKSPKSNQQISDINPKSHVRMKLTQLPQNMNSQSETPEKTNISELVNETNSVPKKSKKPSRNIKLAPESSKRTGTSASECSEVHIALTEIPGNEKAIDVLPVQVKNSSIQPSKIDKLISDDGQKATASTLLPETKFTGDEKDYEAFCIMQKICSSLGISLEDLLHNPKLAKKLKTRQMRGADPLFFLQAHKLVNGNIVPSLHVHNSKKKLEETLHQLARNS